MRTNVRQIAVIFFLVCLTFGIVSAQDITVDADTTWEPAAYTYDNVVITNGAILTFNGAVTLNCANLTINTGSSISADGKGYGSGVGPGAGGPSGAIVPSGSFAGGAGYGGAGGNSLTWGSGGPTYGSAMMPLDMGSGGGGDRYPNGGSGGGVIRLTVSGVSTINGNLTANGTDGWAQYHYGWHGGGGGSGGSVYMSTGALSGSGVISAQGGGGGGGGGGGRIAIYCDTNTFTGTIDAGGGAGYEAGEDGTIAMNPGSIVNLAERSSSQSTSTETFISQQATLNNGQVSGDLTGTLSFTEFEMVGIATGSFAGKGFSKGQWSATLESLPYQGSWEGMFLLRPNERKIYLKGAVSGELSGTVEGFLSESTPESGIYDQYQAEWKIGKVKEEFISCTLNLTGTLSYQESAEYPGTEIYVLQTSVEGQAVGHYTGALSTVLTHIRINSQSNPYYGEGFSIISYVSNIGQGEAWAYNNLISPDVSELKGISAGPLLGIISGTLNETVSPRTLILTVERIDLGLPPAPDLKVLVWGPGRVSPGQTINYIIEYRNDGLKAADEAILFCALDPLVKYISGSAETNYNEFFHEVTRNFGPLPAKTAGYMSVKVAAEWGLPLGTTLDSFVHVIEVQSTGTLSYDDMGMPCSGNLALNGVDNPPGSENRKNWEKFANNANAKTVQIYQTDWLNDSSDVLLGTPEYVRLDAQIPPSARQRTVTIEDSEYIAYYFANNNNGLTQSEIINACYHTVWAHSGGTRTALTAILYENLECERLVLISPMAGLAYKGDKWDPEQIKERYKWELEKALRENPEMTIVVYQSLSDVLLPNFYIKLEDGSKKRLSEYFQVKFYPEGEDKAWFDRVNKEKVRIQVNPESLDVDGKKVKKLEIDVNEINTLGHGGLIDYIKTKFEGNGEMTSSASSIIAVARDPNRKLGPDGRVSSGEQLNYKVEYENEGEGIAFGVYFTDTLDEDLNDSTLEIGPVIDVNTGSQIAPPGIYNPATRTITWFVGQVDPNQGGYADFSVNVKPDAPHSAEIINFATVYFPSVPEATRTNGIVSIVSLNRPPVANAGPDQTVEQASYAGAEVILNGSGSTDLDSTPGTNDDIVSFEWYKGAVLLGSGQTLNHTFPLGSHTVTLKVTDTFGETDDDEVIVTIQDTTPPQFTLSVSPTILKPVNHKMVRITPSWTLHDICDSSPQVSLVSIVANEGADTIGDGHTSPDIEIRNDGSIYLRAERSGTGTGRIYTLTWQAIDDSGNATKRSATVTVPHDQRK